MNKEEILNTFLLANIPEIITQEEFDDVKKAIKDLQQENKESNQKYLNAVADYETTMFEKEQLNSLVNSCQEEIRQFKKQLETINKKYNFESKYREKNYKMLREKDVQQKEFIEYINEKIDICDGFIDTIRSDLEEISGGGRIAGKTYIANKIMENEVAKKILEEILSKYKEIIGGKE